MMSLKIEEQKDLTVLLGRYEQGDQAAQNEIFTLVYEDMRRTAARLMRGEPAHATLQATGLVHETFLRLLEQKRAIPENRMQFFAIAATFMRRILVDAARARRASKRGGEAVRVDFTQNLQVSTADDSQIVEVDQALTQLASQDQRAAQVVEMRYFGGYENEEIAHLLSISLATVKRDLAFAKAWLLKSIAYKD
jgi:RNA polymerase sigma factor (TIGR02999 family)